MSMIGGATTGNSSDAARNPITEGRKTFLRFDVPLNGLIESAFYRSKRAEEIGLSPQAVWAFTRLAPGIGIQLNPYQSNIGYAQEYGDNYNNPVTSTTDGGTMQMADAMKSSNGWRSPTDQTGATVGANPLLAAQGFPLYSKTIPSDNTWNDAASHLASDQSAFPSPEPQDDGLVMARVGTDTVPHDQGSLFFGFWFPGPTQKASSGLLARYFSGPAGETANRYGSGNYCLKFRGDGVATLYESQKPKDSSGNPTGSFEWSVVSEFRFAESNAVYGLSHWVEARPHKFAQPRNDIVGTILFICGISGSAPGTSISPISQVLVGTGQTNIAKYQIPGINPVSPPTLPAPIRADERRDLVPEWHIAKALYPTTGYVLDDVFLPEGLIGVLGSGNPEGDLFVIWKGDTSNSTSVTINLFKAGQNPQTATPITPIGSVLISGVGGYNYYDSGSAAIQDALLNFGGLQAELTLNGDGDHTPTVYNLLYSKRALTNEVAPGEWTGGDWVDFSKLGAGLDPTTESGQIRISDPDNEIPLMRTRTIIPFSWETQYSANEAERLGLPPVDWSDLANDKYRSKIMRGYVQNEPGTQMGSEEPTQDFYGNSYTDPRHGSPSLEWQIFNLACVGEWRRASKILAPGLKDFSVSLESATENPTGAPSKVTDAIREMFGWMGYDTLGESQFYIPPDAPDIRIWPNETEGVKITPGAGVLQFCIDLARDYLNYWIDFDPNAATDDQIANGKWYGVWRLIAPPSFPYNNLAYFDTAPTGGSGFTTGATLIDWPAITLENGQKMVGAPIYKRPRTWRTPPEFNKLTVIGLSGPQTGKDQDNSSVYAITCYNPRSYNFIPGTPTADPTSPDYLPSMEEARIINPQLPTGYAVGFIAARTMSYAGVGREFIAFDAPLVLVWDVTDPIQVTPRPLRYYDPVIIYGEQYFITSCNPFYRKDGLQMAHYEAQKEIIPIPGLPMPL